MSSDSPAAQTLTSGEPAFPKEANPSEEIDVMYFSYGSNMSRTKMKTRGSLGTKSGTAGVHYNDVFVGRVQDWTLTFDIRGMPPREPVMGSIEPLKDHTMFGVVYHITSKQALEKLKESEGMNSKQPAYVPVEIDVDIFKPESPDDVRSCKAFTLTTSEKMRWPNWRQKNLFPSKRYMNLLIDGARQEHLPEDYIAYLQLIPTARIWPDSVLMFFCRVVVPFLFFLRRYFGTPVVMRPVQGMAMELYGIHEGIARTEDDSIWKSVKLCLLYCTIFLVYFIYFFPALLYLALSERGRQGYRFMSLNNAATIPTTSKKET